MTQFTEAEDELIMQAIEDFQDSEKKSPTIITNALARTLLHRNKVEIRNKVIDFLRERKGPVRDDVSAMVEDMERSIDYLLELSDRLTHLNEVEVDWNKLMKALHEVNKKFPS